MKDEVYARVARLAQTRDKLVKLRTTLKTKVNNLLAAWDTNPEGVFVEREGSGGWACQ